VFSRTHIRTRLTRAAVFLILIVAGVTAPPLIAQAPTGPQTPPKAPDIVRLPTNPAPEKSAIPPEEIIRQFTAHEDELASIQGRYIYTKTLRLEEIGADGKVAGRAEVNTSFVKQSDGSWRPRTSRAPESTLRFVDLEPDALQMLSGIPTLPFGSQQLAKYDVQYRAAEPVDELMTYVFELKPKQLDRENAYFSGLIWVDNEDLAVVKAYGKWVSELGDMKPGNLPFTLFETYRQPVSNKYWLPAYSRADGTFASSAGNVPVRLIILWDNYRPISANAEQPQPSAAETPQQSQP
jgi:hypothetical protein